MICGYFRLVRRLEDRVADAKTVWLFREALKQCALGEVLFKRFDESIILSRELRESCVSATIFLFRYLKAVVMKSVKRTTRSSATIDIVK